ncbi:MAG: hypothetical protein DRR42_11365 [Gammaproteobacteria bacterium]|nr:MAG: hypothetical protein DRR42_11365 [Gammaproteobacteria bacterium]
MLTAWEKLRNYTDDSKCRKCNGHGQYDDAEPGDISYITYKCLECKGTGFKNGAIQVCIHE